MLAACSINACCLMVLLSMNCCQVAKAFEMTVCCMRTKHLLTCKHAFSASAVIISIVL